MQCQEIRNRLWWDNVITRVTLLLPPLQPLLLPPPTTTTFYYSTLKNIENSFMAALKIIHFHLCEANSFLRSFVRFCNARFQIPDSNYLFSLSPNRRFINAFSPLKISNHFFQSFPGEFEVSVSRPALSKRNVSRREASRCFTGELNWKSKHSMIKDS
jgi:hypothetical protein